MDSHQDGTAWLKTSKIKLNLTLARLPRVLVADCDTESPKEPRGDALLRNCTNPTLLNQLANAICRRWLEAVHTHFKENPITESELAKAGAYGWECALHSPQKLYGTTLVAGIMLPEVCLLLQQGDGSSTVLLGDGTCVHPIPEDDRCVGNVTTSISDEDAVEGFRFAVLDPRKESVVGCLVTTDGVDNSFPLSNEGTADLLRGIALKITEDATCDYKDFLSELGNTLIQMSESGSGDDASVAGFVDVNAGSSIVRALEVEREHYGHMIELMVLRERLASMERKHKRIVKQLEAEEQLSEADFLYLEKYEDILSRTAELERGGVASV